MDHTIPSSTMHQLKITLLGTKPAVWRRVVVPSSISLAHLHVVIQGAFGWSNDHLHAFDIDGYHVHDDAEDDFFPGDGGFGLTSPFGHPGGVADSGSDPRFGGAPREADVSLGEVAGVTGRFHYTYDFGDDWRHLVVVEDIVPSDPTMGAGRCIAGRRACPPEDCGGTWGYHELVEILANPDDPDYAERLEWCGPFDPAHFDLDETNALMVGYLAQAPHATPGPRVFPGLEELLGPFGQGQGQGGDGSDEPMFRALVEGLTSAELVEMFGRRPTLLLPTPPRSLTELGVRVSRADDFEHLLLTIDPSALVALQIVLLAADRPGTDDPELGLATPDSLDALVAPTFPRDAFQRAVEVLVGLGLVFRLPDGVLVPVAINEMMGPPLGLGPLAADLVAVLPGPAMWTIVTMINRTLHDTVGLLPPPPSITHWPNVKESDALERWLGAFYQNPQAILALIKRAPADTQGLLAQTLFDHPTVDCPAEEIAASALHPCSVGWPEDVRHPERREFSLPLGRPATGLEWLLQHGLFFKGDWDFVVVPREVGVAARGGITDLDGLGGGLGALPVATTAASDSDSDSELPREVDTVGAAVRDAVGTEAGRTLRGQLADLLRRWTTAPPALLKGGGVGKRTLKAVGDELHTSIEHAYFLVGLASAAGLVEPGILGARTFGVGTSGGKATHFVVTPAATAWRECEPSVQWSYLLAAWLTAPGRCSPSDPAKPVFIPGASDPHAESRRLAVLSGLAEQELVGAGGGKIIPPRFSLDGVDAFPAGSDLAVIAWLVFRFAALTDEPTSIVADPELMELLAASPIPGEPGELGVDPDVLAARTAVALVTGLGASFQGVLTEAHWLGIAVDNHLTSGGHAVLARLSDAIQGTLAFRDVAELVHPALVGLGDDGETSFTVQADGTVTSFGPLRHDLARMLEWFTDRESEPTSLGLVVRLTDHSLARGFDRGLTSSTILTFLDEHSDTPLPSGVRYMIEDAQRRYGQVSVRGALTVLVATDPAVLADAASHRLLRVAAIEVVAPTVAVSAMPADQLHGLLRSAGVLSVESGEPGEPGRLTVGRSPDSAIDHGLGGELPTNGEFSVDGGLPPILPRSPWNPLQVVTRAQHALANAGHRGTYTEQLTGMVSQLLAVR